MTLDEKTGEFVASKVKALQDMGIQETYQLVTESGKKIRTTGNHPYFVKPSPTPVISGTFEADQSNRIEDLSRDSFIAVANSKYAFVAHITKEEKRYLFKRD